MSSLPQRYSRREFEAQPCWGWATSDYLVPLYRCEMRVWQGKIDRLDAALPYETNDDEHLPDDAGPIGWEVTFHGGSRRCFLPVGFAEDGPVRLTFGPYDSPKIVISGSRVSLEVGEQVGSFESRPNSQPEEA